MSQPIPPLPKVQPHHSFTRDLYDSCEYEKYVQESTGPFNWLSQKVYENPAECHVDQSPYMRGVSANGIERNDIDIESELRNITRINGRCPEMKYDPSKHTVDTPEYKGDCRNSALVPEYTRMDRPCNVLSGVSTFNLSIHPLCKDLQDTQRIHRNSYIGANTRLITRDAYAQKMGRPQ